ncbi:MAG TPA: YihY/virulence factor BrkB family protein, partial [Novosphingobium sp.]|nr:YihY/virulence factor BrkB family protein [Novosphingobium sp.]
DGAMAPGNDPHQQRLFVNTALRDLTPEARRRRAGKLGTRLTDDLSQRLRKHVGPRTRAFYVIQRVVTGVWRDGFIHAGNLAYMAILALFPFFIVVGALFSAVGEGHARTASVHAFLTGVPRVVSSVLEPVAESVITARHGWLLWAGGAVGLWTVSSLIETIRDILRRAYGTVQTRAFWRYRLLSGAIIVLAVLGLLVSLYAQVAIGGVLEVIHDRWHPFSRLDIPLRLSRLVPMMVLFGSLYALFYTLTPSTYRAPAYPKWPGAALVTLWWGLVSIVLPGLLRVLFKYDLTYGSLAGVMIALFFFWLVGLGMVTGAELNAALAVTPEERDWLGQSDDRERENQTREKQTRQNQTRQDPTRMQEP